MSIFSAVGKVLKTIKGKGAGGVVASTAAGAAGGALLGGGGSRRRRRSRKRLTDQEIAELMMLKSIVGPRSPLMTIAGLKMLGRG